MLSRLNIFKASYLLALAVISSLILALSINLQLVYHLQQPLFLFDNTVLSQSFKLPGGFIKYIANFFTELYYFPILGVFFLILIIAIIPFSLYYRTKKQLNETIALLLSSLVFLISLLLFANYTFRLSSFLLIIGAYVFFHLNRYILKTVKNIIIIILLILITSVFNYIILGGLGLLVSNILLFAHFIISEQSKKKKFILTSSLILFNLLIPILFFHTIYQLVPLFDAYFSDIIIINASYKTSSLYYVFISSIILSEFLLKTNTKTLIYKNQWNYWATYIVFGLIIWQLPKYFIDRNEKSKIEIDYWAYNKQWNKILNINDKAIFKDRLSAFQFNRALFFTEGLLNELFSIPQYFGNEALLVEQNVIRPVLMPSSDIYYDLSFINESRHWAHEAYTSFGKQPRVLRRLVEVNIINQKYNTTSKYIMLLKKSMINRAWAIKQEKYLFNEALIANNITYSTKRNNIPTEDFFTNINDPSKNLNDLLKQSDSNKMAFEYLIANYLMRHEIIYIVNLVPEFRKYNYVKLPRLVQEAILLYMVKTNKQTIDLSGYQIDPDNIKRIQDYSKLYNLYRNNDKKAKEKIDNIYSDSYWYYIHFNSPITNKR